jgi:hypothetical protein
MKNRNWLFTLSMLIAWLGYFLAAFVVNANNSFFASIVAVAVTVGSAMFFKHIFILVPKSLAAFASYAFGFFALWATIMFK